MSCRYSLSDITLARLGIVGIVNAAISIIITAFILWRSEVSLLPIVAYLYTPYLLACALSLFSLNRFRGKERLYVCGGASCLVSVASVVILNPSYVNFTEISWLLWTFAVLVVWTGAETIKFIKKMEDTQWNLSLTV
jgi:Na+/melibiose symporter-like transporter